MEAAGVSSSSGRVKAEANAAFVSSSAEQKKEREAHFEGRGDYEETRKPERGVAQDSLPQTASNATQTARRLKNEKELITQSPKEEMRAKRNTQCFFACRRCRRLLFVDANVLHDTSERVEQASANATEATPSNFPEKNCTSVFIEPLEWMEGLDSQQGRLHCPNPSCQGKLGSWSWHGLRCSCGKWQVPAFQVHLSRVDRLPAVLQGDASVPSALF